MSEREPESGIPSVNQGGAEPAPSNDATRSSRLGGAAGFLRLVSRWTRRWRRKANRALDQATDAMEKQAREIDTEREKSPVWTDVEAQRRSLEEMEERIKRMGK